jgi:NAD+ diphosphatase
MSWLAVIDRCPRCAAPRTGSASPFRCPACALTLFANPAVGVGCFITNPDGQVLFTVRAKHPGKGMLGLPGGFVDAGENAEDALRREAREEIGGQLGAIRYLCSSPNRYHYGGVDYDVLDLFYTAQLLPGALVSDPEEIGGLRWLQPADVRVDDIAFPSMREAWRQLRGG